MSYELVQSMIIKRKELKVSFNFRCNNDTAGYRTNAVEFDNEDEFDSYLKCLFESLLSGTLVFNFSSTSKAHYAYLKALEYGIENLGIRSAMDLWYSDYDKEHVFSLEETIEKKKEMEKVFLKSLSEPMIKKEAQFKALNVYGPGYDYFITSYNSKSGRYRYEANEGKVFDTIKTLYLKLFLSNTFEIQE